MAEPNDIERAAAAMKRPTLPSGKLVFVAIITVATSIAFHINGGGGKNSAEWLAGAFVGAIGASFLVSLPWILRRRQENRVAFMKAWDDRKNPFRER